MFVEKETNTYVGLTDNAVRVVSVGVVRGSKKGEILTYTFSTLHRHFELCFQLL
jgi:hypothetical protein